MTRPQTPEGGAVHTPGPWVVHVEVLDGGGWRTPQQNVTIYTDDEAVVVASYSTEYAEYPDDATNEANAYLMAAAPALLTELRRLRDCLKPWIEGGHRVPGIATLNGADAAIAKATGEGA